MFRFAVMLLVAAGVAALFGYGLVADVTSDAAKVGFFVLLTLSVVMFIADAFDDRSLDGFDPA